MEPGLTVLPLSQPPAPAPAGMSLTCDLNISLYFEGDCEFVVSVGRGIEQRPFPGDSWFAAPLGPGVRMEAEPGTSLSPRGSGGRLARGQSAALKSALTLLEPEAAAPREPLSPERLSLRPGPAHPTPPREPRGSAALCRNRTSHPLLKGPAGDQRPEALPSGPATAAPGGIGVQRIQGLSRSRAEEGLSLSSGCRCPRVSGRTQRV